MTDINMSKQMSHHQETPIGIRLETPVYETKMWSTTGN